MKGKITRICLFGFVAVAIIGASVMVCVHLFLTPISNWNKADWFANGVFVYCSRHDVLPVDIDDLFDEMADETSCSGSDIAMAIANCRYYVKANFVIQRNHWTQVLNGADYVKPKLGASSNDAYIANVVNDRLRWYLRVWEYEKARGIDKKESYRGQRQKIVEGQCEGRECDNGE